MSAPETPPTVTGAEIGEFLKGNPDLKSGVSLPITEADLGITSAKEEAPPETTAAPKAPLDPTFAANLQTEGNTANAALQSAEIAFKPEDVALTELERETFLKAMLQDDPVVLSIRLPGWLDTVFTIRTRSNLEQRLMFRVLERDEKNKETTSTTEWLQWLQYYAASYQLLRVGKTPYTPPEHTAKTSLETASKELREYVEENFLPLSVLKWHLVTAALRLFEAKVNLAANELLSRDFSKPAG
jgi:hypothetical protein